MKKTFRKWRYNGTLDAFLMAVPVVVIFLIAILLQHFYLGDNFEKITNMLFMAVVVYFIFAFFKVYLIQFNGKTLYTTKLFKRTLSQKIFALVNKGECVIDVFNEELIEAVEKYVVHKKTTLVCRTHGYVIHQINKHLGDKVDIVYDENDFTTKDLKNEKRYLAFGCKTCKTCDRRSECKLYQPKTVEMYNVTIKPKL